MNTDRLPKDVSRGAVIGLSEADFAATGIGPQYFTRARKAMDRAAEKAGAPIAEQWAFTGFVRGMPVVGAGAVIAGEIHDWVEVVDG